MAHGFLTPTPVSGDRYWQNAKSIFDLLSKLLTKGKKADPKGGPLMAFQQNGQKVQAVKVSVETPQKSAPPAVVKMLGATARQMLGGGNTSSNIATTGDNTAPSSGPQLPGAKGGSFVDIATPSAGLNADTFFKSAVISGVNPSTGEYLSKEDRISAFKSGRSKVEPASSGPEISADSGVEIVAAVNRMTMAVMNLVDATKSQTETQKQLSQAQLAQADQLSQRARAEAKEKALEKGSDLSGFLTASGGLGGMRPGAGGTGGGSGGSGGGPGLGIGGKVVAQAVGKRGAGRLGSRLAAKFGGKAAAKAAQRYGGKIASKLGVKAAGGAIAKSLAKKVPVLGLGVGALFAAKRALEGDLVGAGLELASGAASTVPGIGTAGSIGLDATLAARDAGMVPFAKGGIVDGPVNALLGEAGREGVFPLEGKQGKDTFLKFGEGILDAQEKRRRDYSRIQSMGLKQYYENEGGFEKMGNIFSKIFGALGSGLKALIDSLTGPANAANRGLGDSLVDPTISGDEEEYLMRLMIAEAGGEGEVGMAAVGRSVLNRAGLIQSGEVRPGIFNAASGSIMDVINAPDQYSPVSQGKLKRDLSPEERARAKKALEMARNQASLRANLEAQGMSSTDINKIMASTGFRTHSARYDASQEVNNVSLGGHRFNTAGNAKMLTPGAVKINTGMQVGNGMAIFGETGRVSNKENYVHGHFQTNTGTKADLVNDVLPVVRGLLNSGVTDVSITSGETFRANMSDAEIRGLIEKGISKHSHSGDGRSVDIFVPKGTKVPFPLSDVRNTGGNGGVTGILPGSGKVWVGHLDPSSKSGVRPHSPNEPNMAGKNTPGPQSPITNNRRRNNKTPGSLQASAANPDTGTAMMATSQQVAMSSIFTQGNGGGGTVINNFYNTGGGTEQQLPNGVAPGMSYTGTGLAAFTLAQLNR